MSNYLHSIPTYFSFPVLGKFYNFIETQVIQLDIKLDLAIMLNCSKLHQSQNVDRIPLNVSSVGLLNGNVILKAWLFLGLLVQLFEDLTSH